MKFLKKIFHFAGGIHVEGHKELASSEALTMIGRPQRVVLSMSQHLGAPSTPCVEKGQHILRYQKVGEGAGMISAPVHSPFAGTVKEIITTSIASGRTAKAVVLDVDAEDGDKDCSMPPILDWQNATKEELLARIREAGVVGAGGAGFPTCVKLSPPKGKEIDTIIINGAECEPYLNGDNRIMIERSEELQTGVSIIQKILGAKRVVFAVEDNKPIAIDHLAKAFDDTDFEIAVLPHSYPQGSEKHVIFSVTGREIPTGRLPADVGCLVENVWTILTIASAVTIGRPVVLRTVTVTGAIVRNPKNFVVPIGMTVTDLINGAGGFTEPPVKAICGGPMMGFAMPSLDLPITKTCSGLVFLGAGEVEQFETNPCISCGRCVQACPMGLMPAEISQAVESEDICLAEKYHVMNCFECGSCAYVCPAHRPLVQHNRRAKSIIMAQRKAMADRAKAEQTTIEVSKEESRETKKENA